ncbi:F-box/kelch-repeat protein At3g06240-like [Salvia hispanica]|uniref:F-box/kelch-repeat protein At3g06240-like n=1 Tax=Salvia hispanica TaxID=49212 RepID=UPI00200981B6|nr:F-box/kelch-repeat protein At3g06240-like [Salvia hispanica]
MKTADNSKMGEDFFKYLPSEIVVNILSRLPTRAAMACKCVCKPWLGMLTTPEFVNSHMSRSVPSIAIETHSKCYDIIEFADELDLNFDAPIPCGVDFNFLLSYDGPIYRIHNDFDKEHRWDVTFSFRLPFKGRIQSSANGLIFLRDFVHDDLILCNPVTRDYLKLPCPRQTSPKVPNAMDNCGFGVSGTTGKYKVVRIFAETKERREGFRNACQVYTVGTGSWKNVPFGKPLRFCHDIGGVHLNGNLYWMVAKTTRGFCRWISCFDLEMEHFSSVAAPPPRGRDFLLGRSLCVLRGCLCVSDISHHGRDHSDDESDEDDIPNDGHVIIWMMKGDDNSWTKIFVIPEVERSAGLGNVWPIIIFRNGDALIEWDDGMIFFYSNKRRNFDCEIMSLEGREPFSSTTIMYAPSFVSLKSFAMENVSSF